MLYGWKEVNSENRRKKCASSTRLDCPRQKNSYYDVPKAREEKKKCTSLQRKLRSMLQ